MRQSPAGSAAARRRGAEPARASVGRRRRLPSAARLRGTRGIRESEMQGVRSNGDETDDELKERLRFEVELEFVQCLSNPRYLNYLAQRLTLEEPSFLAYLEYLRYWKQPQYAKFIQYPRECGASSQAPARPRCLVAVRADPRACAQTVSTFSSCCSIRHSASNSKTSSLQSTCTSSNSTTGSTSTQPRPLRTPSSQGRSHHNSRWE